MSVRQQNNVAYGLSQPLIDTPLLPIVSNRAPTSNDKAALGTIWVDKSQNIAYILTSVVNDIATWINITQDTADFTTFTGQIVGAGPTALETFGVPLNSSLTIGGYYQGNKDDFSESVGGLFTVSVLRGNAGAPAIVPNVFNVPAQTNGAGNAALAFAIVGNDLVINMVGNGGETWNWKVVLTTVVLP